MNQDQGATDRLHAFQSALPPLSPQPSGPGPATGVPTRPRTRFEQLTALRFFASLLVVISHASMMTNPGDALSWFGRHVIDYGHGRVGFFFMLSGFVLCHAYEAKLASRALGFRTFLVRRFMRIWPLHILVAAPLAVWMLWRVGPPGLPIAATNFALLQSWIPIFEYYSSLNGPSWSLSTELFLYAVFPLLIALPRRVFQVLCPALVLWSFVAPVGLALAGYGHVLNSDGTVSFGYWFTAINPAMRLTEFVIGITLCRLLRDKVQNGGEYWLPRWADGASLAAFVMAMMAFSALHETVPDIFFNQAFYLPFLTLLVLALAEGRGRVSRWLAGQRTLRFLGETSFAIYIIHNPVLRRGFDIYSRLGEPIPVLAFAIGMILVCIAVGCCVHLFVEQPLQRLIRDWMDRPAKQAPA